MLSLPVVLLRSATKPIAVLLLPVVLFRSAAEPVAVLKPPVELLLSASKPLAVLFLPVVRLKSALKPMAVLLKPVIRLKSACSPSAVFWLGYPPSGGGSTACAVGESAKQASTKGMRRNARKGEQFIKFLNGIVFVFIYAEF